MSTHKPRDKLQTARAPLFEFEKLDYACKEVLFQQTAEKNFDRGLLWATKPSTSLQNKWNRSLCHTNFPYIANRKSSIPGPLRGHAGYEAAQTPREIGAWGWQMNPNHKFLRNGNSTILTPGAAGVSKLVEGLDNGATIRASQRRPNPIELGNGAPQWLECETSGSTGRPKTIRRQPCSWISSFEITHQKFSVGQSDVYAVLGSLGHSLSLFASLEALHIGADLCVLSGIPPKRQLHHIETDRVTVLYATPTQLESLSTAAQREGIHAAHGVRIVFVGGGMLSTQAKDRLSRFFQNADIIQFYGTSETSFVTITDASTPNGSVGRPYPKVQLRMGALGQNSDSGEIFVRSPYLFDGYADRIEPNGTDRDGFLRTGEMGYQDASGYLFLKGRADRMVTISDVSVHPEAIEAAVSSMTHVETCAVVTVPDEKRGHRAVCFIVTPSLEVSPSIVRQHCRTMLGAPYVPKEVWAISELPLLPSGKPDLHALKERISEQ